MKKSTPELVANTFSLRLGLILMTFLGIFFSAAPQSTGTKFLFKTAQSDTNSARSIKSNTFVTVWRKNQKIKGKLEIINDTLIKVDGSMVSINEIDKLRIGHFGTNLTLAIIGGTIALASMGTAILAFGNLSHDDDTPDIVYGTISTGTFIAGTVISFKAIRRLKWLKRKDYNFWIRTT